jgi:sugar O-acyltransferase (sialic acid O-acetyltransferase NeuD family)
MPTSPSFSAWRDKTIYGLQGTGGCARGIMPLLSNALLSDEEASERDAVCVYVEPEPRQAAVNGTPVLSEATFIALECGRKLFNVGIADPATRRRVYERYLALGMEPVEIRAASAIVFDHSTIGEGAVLCPNTVVTANVTIGKMFQLNLYSYVEHDCVIGDFVTFAPGVRCNGAVHIGDNAYLGSGAILRQGTSEGPLVIGAGAVVGMGAVVTKDVAPGSTVVGNPARPLTR